VFANYQIIEIDPWSARRNGDDFHAGGLPPNPDSRCGRQSCLIMIHSEPEPFDASEHGENCKAIGCQDGPHRQGLKADDVAERQNGFDAFAKSQAGLDCGVRGEFDGPGAGGTECHPREAADFYLATIRIEGGSVDAKRLVGPHVPD
jgi:hypothetical protein